MNETYQNRITDQICKIQTDKKLIAFYDKLLTTSYNSFAQLHAKGEYVENGHKAHSLIGISIQDYSSGTGDRNIITRFHLAPEQIQFLLTRITAGFRNLNGVRAKSLEIQMRTDTLLHSSSLYPAMCITANRKFRTVLGESRLSTGKELKNRIEMVVPICRQKALFQKKLLSYS